MLDVDIERFALEEELEVTIMLKYGMCGCLVQHALKSSPSRLDKVGIKAANGLFLWGRGDYDARIIIVQLAVEPEKVTIAAGDGKFGLLVGLGGSLDAITQWRGQQKKKPTLTKKTPSA